MFTVKVEINGIEIDRIDVLNTGKIAKDGKHIYKFKTPKGLEEIEFRHRRSLNRYHLMFEISKQLVYIFKDCVLNNPYANKNNAR